jgi:hypothetical protein
MSFATLCVLGVLFGVGFGYCTQRSGLCFAHGLGEIFVGRGKRILRLFLVIFAVTALGFWLSSYADPGLGLRTVGQIRGHGFYNVLSGMLFGAGIFISGGCILGTLRQIGEGNMTFVITLAFFIPGMALIVFVVNPLLEHGYAPMNVLLTELTGVPASSLVPALVGGAVVWLAALLRRRR